MDWQGAIAIVIGAVGAAVSGWTAYWTWRARRSELNVSLAYGTLSAGQHASPVIWVRVVNRGSAAVEIELVGLVAPDGRRLASEPSGGDMPTRKVLRARTTDTCWFSPGAIAEALSVAGYIGTVPLRAYCVDALGGEFRSEPLPFEARSHFPMAKTSKQDGLG